MCELSAGYTTVVGPDGSIRELDSLWPRLRTSARFGLGSWDLYLLGDRPDYQGPDCPSVLVARHDPGLGPQVADNLQVELMQYSSLMLICEPGYQVGPVSTPPHGGPVPASAPSGQIPTATLDPQRVNQAQQSISPGMAGDIAVIDSGCDPAVSATMDDFLTGQPASVPASDDHGHGTAVTSLVQALRPQAAIHPVRILDANGRADSFNLFLALTFCLWPGIFPVVNASLTTQLTDQCATSLGRSITYIVNQCRTAGKAAGVTLVAAAGNTPFARRLGYPALAPDAEVVTALDWNGADPGYNVPTAGAGVNVIPAFGGTSADPFGQLTRLDGTTEAMFGTSFAAAVVSSSHLS
jgi:subtilisin family serine protease